MKKRSVIRKENCIKYSYEMQTSCKQSKTAISRFKREFSGKYFNRYVDKNLSNSLNKEVIKQDNKYELKINTIVTQDVYYIKADLVIFRTLKLVELKKKRTNMTLVNVNALARMYLKENKNWSACLKCAWHEYKSQKQMSKKGKWITQLELKGIKIWQKGNMNRYYINLGSWCYLSKEEYKGRELYSINGIYIGSKKEGLYVYNVLKESKLYFDRDLGKWVFNLYQSSNYDKLIESVVKQVQDSIWNYDPLKVKKEAEKKAIEVAENTNIKKLAKILIDRKYEYKTSYNFLEDSIRIEDISAFIEVKKNKCNGIMFKDESEIQTWLDKVYNFGFKLFIKTGELVPLDLNRNADYSSGMKMFLATVEKKIRNLV